MTLLALPSSLCFLTFQVQSRPSIADQLPETWAEHFTNSGMFPVWNNGEKEFLMTEQLCFRFFGMRGIYPWVWPYVC
jgi:hypothetical protein